MRIHDVLGVPVTASQDEMQRAYRKKCMELHPDTNGGDPVKTERFKELQNLWSHIKDGVNPVTRHSSTSWSMQMPDGSVVTFTMTGFSSSDDSSDINIKFY